MLVLSIVGLLVLSVDGYKMFQDRIPNGDGVPNPCLANHMWKGVGHENNQGGGNRNPFGKDFKENDLKWDKELCQKDSDGDGRTNGQELGDPDCQWRPGESPQTIRGLGHPGICEPILSSKCSGKNDWLECDKTVLDFECNGTKASDVVNITVHLDKAKVPATDTNYYCQLVELPADEDYHIIATKPMLDNEKVIHHMILYGCPSADGLDRWHNPQPCGMQAVGICSTSIAGWTVGSTGDCLDGLDTGIRMGKSSFRYALLQVHWNNPEEINTFWDGSGITLFYTKNLRTHNMGTMSVSQSALLLPPGRKEVNQTAVCKGSCTSTFIPPEGVKVISSGLHMHYAGRGGYLSVYRGGRKVKSLAQESGYSYDSPLTYYLEEPFVLMPGDEIRLTCSYKTTNRHEVIYYGDATSDEMCDAFISYFPEIEDKVTYCTSFDTDTFCAVDANSGMTHLGDCPLAGDDEYFAAMTEACDLTGRTCWESCKQFFTKSSNPCKERGPKMFFEYIIPKTAPEYAALALASRSCDGFLYGFNADKPTVDSAPTFANAFLALALCVAASFILSICY